jgi:hypothetical protein
MRSVIKHGSVFVNCHLVKSVTAFTALTRL